ncbi:MAG: hypothetical protein Q8922_09890 [Bacteroidota bacterium]|nr:hypothetical protein [Bacteroidota bacterium]MDP4232866.1 hypothetical protein [Bacteroidota bacterium]MDP4241910.1 hypothetical protein [Bacteroidota bacterium]MDP4288235.1 hypothetical protein [Bacteroidota bacterium]
MTNSQSHIRSSSVVIHSVLLVLILLLLIDQSRFLFTYPVPDTGMWFGDESWTMLTARAFAATGVAHMPEAIGSSLAYSNGLINGSIWITGLLYGIPATFLALLASPVAIGRSMTMLLSIVTLLISIRASRLLTEDRIAVSLSVLALVSCDAFAFSSHSARFDTATGLATLAYLVFLWRLLERGKSTKPITSFAIVFLGVLSLAIYVHVPTLIALPALYALWRIDALRNWRCLLSALAGLLGGSMILVGAYWATTGSVDLLGHGYNQYYNVANSLPILHPFSWQVQKINTIDRAVQVWQVAWPLVLLMIIGVLFRIWKRHRFTASQVDWLMLSALTLVGWCAFEGPAVFYNIHILPVVAVCCAVTLGPLLQMRLTPILATIGMVAIAVLTIMRQESYGRVAQKITRENSLESFLESAHDSFILVDEPALNEVAYYERSHAGSNLHLMTKHFLLFGAENRSPAEILRDHNVRYLLLYSTVRWQSQLRPIADSFYTVIGERTGHLTDQARSYCDPRWDDIDTLRLYQSR